MEVGSWTDHGATGIASTSSKPYNAIDPALVQATDGSYYMSFGSFWGDSKPPSNDFPPFTSKPDALTLHPSLPVQDEQPPLLGRCLGHADRLQRHGQPRDGGPLCVLPLAVLLPLLQRGHLLRLPDHQARPRGGVLDPRVQEL